MKRWPTEPVAPKTPETVSGLVARVEMVRPYRTSFWEMPW